MRARLLIGSALLLGAAYFAIFGGEYDLFDLRHVRAERDAEEQRVTADRAAVEALRARRDSLLHDSATIERVARERYGLVRDGERLYRFTDAPPDTATDTATAPATTPVPARQRPPHDDGDGRRGAAVPPRSGPGATRPPN